MLNVYLQRRDKTKPTIGPPWPSEGTKCFLTVVFSEIMSLMELWLSIFDFLEHMELLYNYLKAMIFIFFTYLNIVEGT